VEAMDSGEIPAAFRQADETSSNPSSKAAAEALSPASAETNRRWTDVHERTCSAIRERLGPDQFTAAYRSGARLSLEEAVAEAAAVE
jgi:hypothetical protein